MGMADVKKKPQTISVFGMELPIIAQLDQGVYLVAHKNGPGVATADSLYSIRPVVCSEDDGGPIDIAMKKAMRSYVDKTWPMVRDHWISTTEG